MKVEVSQESPKHRQKSAKIGILRSFVPGLRSVRPFVRCCPGLRPVRSFVCLFPASGRPIRSFPASFDRFLQIFADFSDFLGRLQPSTTTIQRTPNTLGVEESSSPRRVLHFYVSNSSRGRMRAESWRPIIVVFFICSDFLGRLQPSRTTTSSRFQNTRSLVRSRVGDPKS